MMNLRLSLAVVAMLLPLLFGCHQRIANQQMQEELRFQEDRIYQLEDWIRQYATQLNDCRSENQALRGGKAASPAPKKPLRILPFGDELRKAPPAPEIDIPEVEIPQVEIPKLETPPAELPAPNRGAQRNPARTDSRRVASPPAINNERLVRRSHQPPPEAQPQRRAKSQPHRRTVASARTAGPEAAAVAPSVALVASEMPQDDTNAVKLSAYEAAEPQDAIIAGITLSRLLTTPLNTDGVPGDDGVMVVVEPRNQAGELVPPTGELSVVIIDRSAATETDARIGRWNFSREETARLYRRTTLGDGIQLKLFWHDRQPTHNRLELYVRLTTPDGRKLEASRHLDVALAESALAAAVEPEKLQPEPEPARAPTPIASEPTPDVSPTPAPPASPAGAIAGERTAPIKDSGLFEIVPLPQVHAPPQLLPTPPRATTIVPAPLTVADPTRVAAVPSPRPRAARPAPPPAEEQVAIPVEPGSEPEASATENEPIPPAPKPRWAPYRKQR